ncbi:Aspartate aminotransferase [Novipirellula galeiformis]|uniref:Aspartate aminotransferase n=1 Tax=Novipirellula galeiformis TaxID=2528004 RepID=A0A5C6CDC2_9BACT|nr:Aspartate aminotransferase [Novipirellula galeiformis]
MNASAKSNAVHRFIGIPTAPPDSILGLTEAFLADKNPSKMNLSVGVYKDASGQTPILKCVKEAERRLIETEATKGYLSIDGLPDYREQVRSLVFGDSIDAGRIAILQTPGGTGALRVAADFIVAQLSPARIWMPSPTWANHPAIFAAAGLASETYRYLGSDRTSFDLAGMLEDLNQKTKPGDAVLLHACCHNPTGVDPTPEDWKAIAKTVAERQLIPLIDFAYQGFGDGIEQDKAGLQTILEAVDEAIVCNSFSKNFGLYSERVGSVCLVAADSETMKAAQSQLKTIVRTNYSNPPRHGGAIVATVLQDAELTTLWKQEVDEMRQRIDALRQQFVETMKTTGAGHDFSFLLKQKGMFSFSGLTPMQVDELKNKHGIYIVGSGRINVAGMSEAKMDSLCQSVASVL